MCGSQRFGPDTASISGLDSLGVPIFVMAEQDRYPCAADVPLPVAIRSAGPRPGGEDFGPCSPGRGSRPKARGGGPAQVRNGVLRA